MQKLLTRDQFREEVFERDNHRCVLCQSPAKDAHHIIERRLWSDGGYYLDNGASVCESCHIKCEQTIISVEDIRRAANILKPIIPDHLYRDERYDKWGNIVMANEQRLRGELFWDVSVQKILKEGAVLDLFTNRVKYPRTHHVPWSLGINDDDRVLSSLDEFKGRRVIVTLKMDGESTTMYSDGIHARSIDGRSHSSRDWVKNFWSSIKHDIPDGWRICGENLYAMHSIKYDDRSSYFMGFSVWTDKNICLDWDSTIEWFHLLGITPVPILYDGIFDEQVIKKLYDPKNDYDTKEGYVVRLATEFSYRQFRTVVGKYVRANHVQSDRHWMQGRIIIPNELAVV